MRAGTKQGSLFKDGLITVRDSDANLEFPVSDSNDFFVKVWSNWLILDYPGYINMVH